jgi:predicted membrane protein
MNIWQIGFVVRSGVSALVVAFLLGYSARYEWGLSRGAIQFGALLTALVIGAFIAVDLFRKNKRTPK